MIQNVLFKPMSRYQNRTISSLKDFGNHFEVWLLEEKRFKDEDHASIDARQRILWRDDGKITRNLQCNIYLEFWLQLSSREFFRDMVGLILNSEFILVINSYKPT